MTDEEAISLLSQIKTALLNNSSWHENTHEPVNSSFDMAIKALQERKTGKWVDAWRYDRYQSGQGLCRYWYRKCSCCDYERDDCDSEKDTMFCPNCGAKMEVGE